MVTCTEEQENLLKSQNISPSLAFQRGIMVLANEEIAPQRGEYVLAETPKAEVEKIKRANRILQEHILKQSDELDKLKNVLGEKETK